MHTDVDEICSGSNPFVTMILRGSDGPSDSRISEVLSARIGKDQELSGKLEEAQEQIEELIFEKNKVLKKLESLQQDNYSLSMQLQVSEECSKSIVYEMQAEIAVLKQSIAQQNRKLQHPFWDMDISPREKELMNQVQKLEMILAETEVKEVELTEKIRTLNQKYEREKEDVDDHLDYIQTLKEEISATKEKTKLLEMQIHDLVHDRDHLSDSLNYHVGKITSLERQHRDQEDLIRSSEREIEDLRASNNHLMEKLEAWSVSISSSPSFRTSINLELELSASDSDLSLYRCKNFYTTISDVQEEEYDDSTVDNSDLTFVIEREEALWNEERPVRR